MKPVKSPTFLSPTPRREEAKCTLRYVSESAGYSCLARSTAFRIACMWNRGTPQHAVTPTCQRSCLTNLIKVDLFGIQLWYKVCETVDSSLQKWLDIIKIYMDPSFYHLMSPPIPPLSWDRREVQDTFAAAATVVRGVRCPSGRQRRFPY